MKSKPKGFILIINIGKERPGSSEDCGNLTKLFVQLGFGVIVKTDLNKKQMKHEIRTFAMSTCCNIDMSVVCIMAHGKLGQVTGADGGEVKIEWVLEQFNNENCPSLIGKPKFFIFVACRGVPGAPGKKDFGVKGRVQNKKKML